MNKINKNLSNARSGKSAFTLAEALIAMAIIGVVAALTIPPLVTNYQKHVVENRLLGFYSMINQALYNYVAINGEMDVPTLSGAESYSRNFAWLNSHILPYIKYEKIEQCTTRGVSWAACIYLNNGDSFTLNFDANGGDIDYCMKCDIANTPYNPRKRFSFQFYKSGNSKKFIEPWVYMWNGTMTHLKNHGRYGCYRNSQTFNYCTKYIQLNGWKIPADYPW